MKFGSLCLAWASSLALPITAANPQAVFDGLGDLPGGDFNSSATGISADGGTVSGLSSSAAGTEAFKWTIASGMNILADIDGGNVSAGASAVSSNGSIACGYGSFGAPGGIVRATRWSGLTPPLQLGTINGTGSGYQYSAANGISSDGSRVVGVSTSGNGLRAFLWTATGPSTGTMTNLGFLIPTPTQSGDFFYNSEATSLTPDGTKVIGSSSYLVSITETIPGRTENVLNEDTGQIITIVIPPSEQTTVLEQGTEAFSWTSAGGLARLGDLDGGGLFSNANAISDDGTIIVGNGQDAAGNEGVVWTNGVIEAIGDFEGGAVNSALNDVNADGTIGVGFGTDENGSAALIWSSGLGIGNINTLLAEQGFNLGGWQLTTATGISADGQVIVGNGINPSGDPEAWRITDALTLLNILVPLPDGLQESLRVTHGKAAQFVAEPGRTYQLLESTNLASWNPEGELYSTADAGDSFTHALPISKEPGSAFYLLGPSSMAAEADTSIAIIDGTLLHYTSERGYIYQAEYSDDLVSWAPFGSPLNSSSDQGPVDRVFIDTFAPANHGKRFYRIEATKSDLLTVPFSLFVGPSIKVMMPLGTQLQLQIRPRFTSDPWTNLGEVFSTGGASTSHSYFTPMPIPRPSIQVVSVPAGPPLNQTIVTLDDGAVISFTSQPGAIYQPQRTTNGVDFTNVGDAIDTTSDTGTTQRTVIDPFDSTNPPANLSYRVVETPVAP